MFKLQGRVLWRWKNTSIDFSQFDGEWDDTCGKESNRVKISRICRQLSLPFNKDIHEWENGQYSCEYNEALRHAFELGLVERVYYIEEFDAYVEEETYYAWKNYFEDCVEPLKQLQEVRENNNIKE
jgi:hypothetical protein